MGKTLGSLGEVRSEIINKFGEDNVDLRINSVTGHSTISITFINSHLNEKTSKDRDRRAQQTVEIVKSRFPQINSVDEIYVLFSRVTTSLVIFRSAIIIDYFAFDKDGKPVHGVFDSAQTYPGADPEEPALTPRVNYSPAQNQTEIYLEGIQLEGVAGNGLTMMPRLTATGDTNKVTPSAPAFIRFDFASFAAKPAFPGVTEVAFIGDRINYQTKGQFSTSRSNDGLASEFLYLTVPYPIFRQMIASKGLTIKLGEKQYQLTNEQVQALRKMTQYVKER